jgi:hypothetical protein
MAFSLRAPRSTFNVQRSTFGVWRLAFRARARARKRSLTGSLPRLRQSAVSELQTTAERQTLNAERQTLRLVGIVRFFYATRRL